MPENFYCRYYVGHRGKFGHEFMEFEITSDGKLRYANNSNYKNDFMIRKEGKNFNHQNLILLFICSNCIYSSFRSCSHRGIQKNYS